MRTAPIRTRRWLSSLRLARRSRGLVLGGVWLRCLTWRRAQDLDRQLARGADPMESDELSLRVGQLGSAKTRTRLACGLRDVVELAHRPPARRGCRPCCFSAKRSGRQRLAERLSTSEPLGVEGLAITYLLVVDASSPLHTKDASRSLTVIAFEALVGLDHGQLSAPATDS
jgi:hypothetical protein